MAGSVRNRGTKAQDTQQDALKSLWRFCEAQGIDFLEARGMAQRIATGQMSMLEALQFVERHLLFREGIKTAQARISDLEQALIKRRRDGRGKRAKAIPATRVCRHCELEKPIEDFAKAAPRLDGSYNRQTVCKLCWPKRYGKRSA